MRIRRSQVYHWGGNDERELKNEWEWGTFSSTKHVLTCILFLLHIMYIKDIKFSKQFVLNYICKHNGIISARKVHGRVVSDHFISKEIHKMYTYTNPNRSTCISRPKRLLQLIRKRCLEYLMCESGHNSRHGLKWKWQFQQREEKTKWKKAKK